MADWANLSWYCHKNKITKQDVTKATDRAMSVAFGKPKNDGDEK